MARRSAHRRYGARRSSPDGYGASVRNEATDANGAGESGRALTKLEQGRDDDLGVQSAIQPLISSLLSSENTKLNLWTRFVPRLPGTACVRSFVRAGAKSPLDANVGAITRPRWSSTTIEGSIWTPIDTHPVTNGLRELPEIKVNTLHGGEQEYRSFRLDLEHPLRPASRARSGRGWHTDITFVANPATVAVLSGVETPSYGGDTIWADLEALYAGFSPKLQNFLDGLQAIHVRHDAATGNPPSPRFDGRSTGPFASLHPLVRVHPETGRKALFLSTGFVKAIHGLSPSESTNLLDYLNEELSGHADYQTRFRWTRNAIAVWDNRSTSHFGPVDGPHVKEQRIVHRTTIGGDLPVGPDGFVSRPLVGELFNTLP